MGLFLGGGNSFSQGLVIGRNFGFGLDKKNSFKQLTLTVHGFMFRRAFYQKDICI